MFTEFAKKEVDQEGRYLLERDKQSSKSGFGIRGQLTYAHPAYRSRCSSRLIFMTDISSLT
jgi:hypothetical protein